MFDGDEKTLADVPLVVLDTETTGLYPGLGHRVVEVAAVRLENWRVVDQVNELVQPGRPLDPQAAAVNGLSDEQLRDAPPFGEVAGRLSALMDGALLVAHNAAFDAGFLGMEYFIMNLPTLLGSRQPVLPNPWLCTLQLARRQFYFGRNNLGDLAHRLGVRYGRAHRALNDVFMVVEVLKRMNRELANQRVMRVGDLLHAQGGAIYTPPPPAVLLRPPLAEAVRDGRRLKILYMGEGGPTERVIDPRYPAEHQGVAYLIAYCHLRQGQRTFRLDRLLNAEFI
ncbi:MAG: exonuclease domain-containing protein [Chloroflexota bacterium]